MITTATRRNLLFILVLCSIQTICWLPAAAQEAQGAGEARVALSREGQKIEVLPPDAWENPYRGQYSEWDYWVWEHYDSTLTFTDLGT